MNHCLGLELQTTSFKWMEMVKESSPKICNHPIETTVYNWMFQVPGGYLLSFPKCIPNSVFTVSRLRVSSGLQRVGGCIHVNTMFQPWKMQKKRRCFCAKTQGLFLFVGLNQQPSLNCFILVPVVLQFFG